MIHSPTYQKAVKRNSILKTSGTEKGRLVQVPAEKWRRRLRAAERKCSAGPRRYRDRVRASQVRIQVEPRTCIKFALSRLPAQGVFYVVLGPQKEKSYEKQ